MKYLISWASTTEYLFNFSGIYLGWNFRENVYIRVQQDKGYNNQGHHTGNKW